MPSWEPILDGDLAQEAWSAIRGVALAVSQLEITPNNATDVALFWAYVAGAFDDDRSAALYEEACLRLCSSLSDHTCLALHGGLAGAGWVIAHISEPESAENMLAEVDEVLLHALEVDRWTREYDLVHGLVGLGVYFVERLTSSSSTKAARALESIVDHLIATSETTRDGITWHTPPALMPAWQLAAAPGGYFNCGVAHGVPGIIGLLGRLEHSRVHGMCHAAMRWMRGQQLPDIATGVTPEFACTDERGQRAARTAWCYGDPGVAIASWTAADHLGSSPQDWKRLAVIAASRDAAMCGVVDACLCHGAAGLGHIYNRCYQASGERIFHEAARRWFRRTLDMRGPQGVGGFVSPSNVAPGWRTSASFLDGSIGVALALLGALQPIVPSWDRLLLCDFPSESVLGKSLRLGDASLEDLVTP